MFLISGIILCTFFMGWGIYWSLPLTNEINWEKMGLYLAIVGTLLVFGMKMMDISNMLTTIEEKLEILINDKEF